jgi:hypothetical protein
MTADQYRRLMEKLHRLAYELEHDAARLRCACPAYARKADAVRAISSQLGKIARGEG